MSTLSTELRNQLAKAIKEARREAEAGARRALEALAVDRHEYFPSMSAEERALRNRLRAHGRQLGDVRERTRGSQEIRRLTHEVAYEHWHRMLFARFLAENRLLVEPDSGVAISMAECEDLARERGEDPWSLASRFAQRMLPAIFRPDDPVLAVTLAPEVRQALERLLESLPVAVFTSDDALGWTYQFWQAERKDEVNASGVKIGAAELPAVTQLFTENYMVLFLFHNTIGAWHAAKVLAASPDLAMNAESEEELRRAVRLRSQGGYDFSYLRFVREPQDGDDEDAPSGPWRPAAGAFEGWPRTAAELRVLDPCCGSGHFLVEGFELLVRLRMDEDALPLHDAIRAVLAESLHGLEIDARCTQIAAFNLALAAWRLAGRPIALPVLDVACSGLSPNATKEQWLALAEQAAAAGGMPAKRDLFGTQDTLLSARARSGLSSLYDLFEKAPELGSLIDPQALRADLFQSDFASVQPLLDAVLQHETGDADSVERAVAAQGMARAGSLLSGRYTLVITNVPYLSRGAQSEVLKTFARAAHGDASIDLAVTFMSRILNLLEEAGTAAIVAPQSWLYLTRYERLRRRILKTRTVSLIARLGSGSFETIGGAVVNVALSIASAGSPGTSAETALVDATRAATPTAKAGKLGGGQLPLAVLQSRMLANPDARILHGSNSNGAPLSTVVNISNGIQSGDYPRFGRAFWELPTAVDGWTYQQTTSDGGTDFRGFSNIFYWQSGDGDFREFVKARLGSDQTGSWIRGHDAWGRQGVLISAMKLTASRYLGDLFDDNTVALIPKNPAHLPAVWAFCSSPEFPVTVREIEPALKVRGSIVKVPFDLPYWMDIAATKYPAGLPEPETDAPTQWLFAGDPAAAAPRSAIHVAVAVAVGYTWPPQRDPMVRVSQNAQASVERVADLQGFASGDGILPLSRVQQDIDPAVRIRRILSTAFGSAWSTAMERDLLVATGAGPGVSLEDWLVNGFFEDHCQLFEQLPFIWHIWDGRRDGFHALVNYHRLAAPDGAGRRTLEALTYSYLGDWIQRQRTEQREGKEGADGRLAAALDLQGQLEQILAGEPPYDLFTRWKPLHEQPVGWEPDINDGVRLSIRPFMSARLRAGGRKGAGILRWKPNITWKKDRGAEPASIRPREEFPWFWGCPGDGSIEERTDFLGGPKFDGNRWNDLHYTNAAKNAARARKAQGTSS